MRHSLVRSFSFAGVPVLMHWSVFVIGALIMAASLTRPVLAIVVPAAYLGVLLLHEAGHAFLARRRGQHVVSIEVYPFFGLCRYAGMADAWDHAVIAW